MSLCLPSFAGSANASVPAGAGALNDPTRLAIVQRLPRLALTRHLPLTRRPLLSRCTTTVTIAASERVACRRPALRASSFPVAPNRVITGAVRSGTALEETVVVVLALASPGVGSGSVLVAVALTGSGP